MAKNPQPLELLHLSVIHQLAQANETVIIVIVAVPDHDTEFSCGSEGEGRGSKLRNPQQLFTYYYQYFVLCFRKTGYACSIINHEV